MVYCNDLMRCVGRGDEAGALRLLDSQPELAAARNDSGISVIATSVYLGRLELARQIAERRNDLDLFEASCIGATRRVETILRSEPEAVDYHSPDGFTPLMLAAHFGHLELLETLIEKGSDLDTPAANASQVCAIHSSAAHSDPVRAAALARTLLEAGACPNTQQQGGYTALHEAVLSRNFELVRTLLAYGASPHVSNDDGDSALQLAVAARETELVELLESQLPHFPH